MMSYIGRAALFSTHLKQGVVLDPSFYETGPNFGMVELGTNIREENGSIKGIRWRTFPFENRDQNAPFHVMGSLTCQAALISMGVKACAITNPPAFSTSTGS